MMHDFLATHRSELIARCRAKVALRSSAGKAERELQHGVSVFIEQLIAILRAELSAAHAREHDAGVPGDIGTSATLHGRELMLNGYTVDEVVHDYGDLCQAISELACEQGVEIHVDEFRILNRCLDDAIANAVTEHGYQHDLTIATEHEGTLNLRLGYLAHELRNQLCTATLALSIIKQGNVGVSGATGKALERALLGLGSLIDRSLAEARVSVGTPVHRTLLPLAEFIYEARIVASLNAASHGSRLVVAQVAPTLAIHADRDLLLAAVGNLLQNAFKFSPSGGKVTLTAHAVADRILIEVQDQCGGLPQGATEHMFSPYTQMGGDRTGLGLGLSIARRSIEANNGILRVHDLPGSGCVFTIDLPRHRIARPPAKPA